MTPLLTGICDAGGMVLGVVVGAKIGHVAAFAVDKAIRNLKPHS